MFPLTRLLLASVSSWSKTVVTVFGEAMLFGRAALGYLFQGRLQWGHLFEQLAFLAGDSLPIAIILTTFSAMVIALQVATQMAEQGGASFVGALVSMALVRELAPIMSGFAVLALAGSAYAAEIASMQSNSQLDALQVLRVDPLRYLVLPRMLAGLLGLPIITVITTIAGLWGGLLVSQIAADIPAAIYLDSVWSQTDVSDIIYMLLKAAAFGLIIALFSCTIGFLADNGGQAVGKAATRAVVWSFVMMSLLDFLLTYLFYGTG